MMRPSIADNSKYNILDNEEVNEIALTFASYENLSFSTFFLEKTVNDLIDIFNVNTLCEKVNFNISDSFLACYNEKNKCLYINNYLIYLQLSQIDNDIYFVNMNLYRILLHEIKHVIQHKMALDKSNMLSEIFNIEFSTDDLLTIRPSEINSDIESSLVVYDCFNHKHNLFQKQLIYTYNKIMQSYKKPFTVIDFCNKYNINNINDIYTHMSENDLFIYGLSKNYQDDLYRRLIK